MNDNYGIILAHDFVFIIYHHCHLLPLIVSTQPDDVEKSVEDANTSSVSIAHAHTIWQA